MNVPWWFWTTARELRFENVNKNCVNQNKCRSLQVLIWTSNWTCNAQKPGKCWQNYFRKWNCKSMLTCILKFLPQYTAEKGPWPWWLPSSKNLSISWAVPPANCILQSKQLYSREKRQMLHLHSSWFFYSCSHSQRTDTYKWKEDSYAVNMYYNATKTYLEEARGSILGGAPRVPRYKTFSLLFLLYSCCFFCWFHFSFQDEYSLSTSEELMHNSVWNT